MEIRVADVDPKLKSEPYTSWGNRKDDIGPSSIEAKIPAIRKASAEAGVPVCGLAPYINATEPDKFELMAKSAKALGARTIRIATPWYRDGLKYDELFSAARAGLRDIEPVARRYGVIAAIEVHMGGITASPSAARRLLEGLDPAAVAAIYDPGNMAYEGYENPRMACEILGPYLAHVHVKNAVWKVESDESGAPRKWTAENAPLREGHANWGEVMKALRSVGYDGYLSLEDFMPMPSREKLVQDLAFLKSL